MRAFSLYDISPDFLFCRYDNCAVPFDNITKQNIMGREFTPSLSSKYVEANGFHPGYERMANAIKDLAETSGKPPLFLSLCQWGRVCGTSRAKASVFTSAC